MLKTCFSASARAAAAFASSWADPYNLLNSDSKTFSLISRFVSWQLTKTEIKKCHFNLMNSDSKTFSLISRFVSWQLTKTEINKNKISFKFVEFRFENFFSDVEIRVLTFDKNWNKKYMSPWWFGFKIETKAKKINNL